MRNANPFNILSWPIVREMYAVFISLQISTMYGVILGYSAYLVPELIKENRNLTSNDIEWIGSSGVSLRVIGGLIDTLAGDALGRKLSLQIAYFSWIIGWLAISFSTDIKMLIISRMFTGLFSGMTTCGVTYVSEIVRDERRSTYLTSFPIFLMVGTQLVYVLTYLFNGKQAALIFAGYSVVIFLLSYTIPESPYWYAMYNRLENADRSINWFNYSPDDDYVKAFSDSIRLNSFHKIRPSFRNKLRIMRSPEMAKKIALTLILILSLQFTGCYTINSYSVQLFDGLKSPWNGEYLGFVYALTCFLALLLLVVVVRRFKRRLLIITSSIGMAISLSIAFVCQAIINDNTSKRSSSAYGYLSVISVLVYNGFLYSGNGSTIWSTIPELYPTILRNTIAGACCMLALIPIPLIVYAYPYLINHHMLVLLGTGVVASIVIGLLTIFFLPETSNITIGEAENFDYAIDEIDR